MKKILLLLMLNTSLVCFGQEEEQKPFFVWDSIAQVNHLKNIEDSSTWDMEMYSNDLKDLKEDTSTSGPFSKAVFPVPNYSIVGKGSFKGIGSTGSAFGLKDFKNILFNSFFVRSNITNKKYIEDNTNEVYFSIVILTDTIDKDNYSHFRSSCSSRNHPNYIGQGYFVTKNGKIDYTAFITPNRDSYAIVNMRLFDLSLGSLILIAPQTDGSLRSMQLTTPDLTSEEIKNYIEKQMLKTNIKEFFNLK